MIKTINFYDFDNEFRNMGREQQFSYEGRKALFEYLEQYEEETNEKVELDVIALCCDYREFESALDCAKEHGYEEGVDLEPQGSLDLIEVAELEEKQAKEWLSDRTSVIEIPDIKRIIIANF